MIMRLRQAHAILEAATALEASGLGFELSPFDYDAEGSAVTVDQMTGFAEFNDPDTPDRNARNYSIDLKPCLDKNTIEVRLTFQYEECLLYSRRSVSQPARDDNGSSFRGLVGAQIAEEVAEIVRRNEKPYQDAHARRTTEQ
ncbi:hypothetical protein [Streptomyces sp. SM13]|uniref:hypothetical protein n=1 Tax=Streptomyces sp. SM13 TaxID=1983803 RepID=UPI000CD5C417|nr:hypothetical protein [Streptomyces sp. SM13]